MVAVAGDGNGHLGGGERALVLCEWECGRALQCSVAAQLCVCPEVLGV